MIRMIQVMNICMTTNALGGDDTADICEDDGDNEEEPDVVACPITHAQAMDMFEKCITWLQYQPEASAYNTSVLISLKYMAAKKHLSTLKQMSVIYVITEQYWYITAIP